MADDKRYSEKIKSQNPERWSGMSVVISDMKDGLWDQEFFNAVETGDAIAVLAVLERGFDPNTKRRGYGDTALHIAASRNAKGVVRVLAETDTCDFTAVDRHGRTAAELAYLYGHNPALSRYLRMKADQQRGLDG